MRLESSEAACQYAGRSVPCSYCAVLVVDRRWANECEDSSEPCAFPSVGNVGNHPAFPTIATSAAACGPVFLLHVPVLQPPLSLSDGARDLARRRILE